MTTATMRTRNVMGGEKPRLADDAYFTPRPLARAILNQLDSAIGPPSLVIEPSAGDGAFLEAVRGRYLPCAGVEILAIEPNRIEPEEFRADRRFNYVMDRYESVAAKVAMIDALRKDRDRLGTASNAVVLGNPPFSLAEEFIAESVRRLSDVCRNSSAFVCFLLRASMLAGAGRYASLYGPEGIGGLRYVWHVVGRPAFTPDGKTDAAEYAVLVWQAGYRGPYEGGWIANWKTPLAIAGGGR